MQPRRPAPRPRHQLISARSPCRPPQAATSSSSEPAERRARSRAAISAAIGGVVHQCAPPCAGAACASPCAARAACRRRAAHRPPARRARAARSSARDVRAHRREEAFGIDAHPQHRGGDRREHAHIRARRGRASPRHRRCVCIAEHDAAVEVEHVGRAQDDAGRADAARPSSTPGRCPPAPGIRRRSRWCPAGRSTGHREQHEEQRVARHVDREAAVAVDLARVQPVVDHADAQEQRARDEAVAEHHHHRAFDALPLNANSPIVTIAMCATEE